MGNEVLRQHAARFAPALFPECELHFPEARGFGRAHQNTPLSPTTCKHSILRIFSAINEVDHDVLSSCSSKNTLEAAFH